MAATISVAFLVSQLFLVPSVAVTMRGSAVGLQNVSIDLHAAMDKLDEELIDEFPPEFIKAALQHYFDSEDEQNRSATITPSIIQRALKAILGKGEPDPEGDGTALAIIESESRQAGPTTFVMNHLAKAGGTTVKSAVMKVFGPRQDLLIIRPERSELNQQDVESGAFTFGLVRNPYDYYVSLWAYTASRPDGHEFRRSLPDRVADIVYPTSSGRLYGEEESDMDAFHEWLSAVTVRPLGLFSMRFYGHYIDLNQTEYLKNGSFNTETVSVLLGGERRMINRNWPHHAKGWDRQEMERIRARLEDFDSWSGNVKCWARTESLVEDTRNCVKLYETNRIDEDGVLNWTSFDKVVEDPQMNPSQHVPCERFFDETTPRGKKLRHLVESADGPLLRFFKYPVCGPAA